jgi:choline dehydrogenase-like flavoprotein
MSDHYDVIVIGSGAGGGTLAHALAPTGARILILERGGFLPREVDNWDSRAVWLDQRYHNSGQWLDAATGKRFSPKQHYYVGGNTKVYGAILFRFRERDFEQVQHVDGVSPAWPIGYRDLEPWYTRAEHLYQVHGERGSDPTEPPSAAPYPYPAISHEPRIAQLETDLRAAGLNPFSLPNGILIDETEPFRSPCIRCATCDGYPCPTNGKADAQVICVEPALRYPNVTLLTHAQVTRLVADPSGRRVERVLVERHEVGPAGPVTGREEYSADLVVVACGAINSAALLLRSADERHPDGLGNSSGVVGRNLMLHNNSSLIAFSHLPNPTRFQKTLGINDYYFGDGDWPYPLGAIQMLGKSDATLIGFDAPDAEDPADLARHAIDFWLTTEDLPLPDNRVTVDRHGQISLHYTPTNLEAHRRLREKFTDLLDTMRCREQLIEGSSYLGGRLGINGVAHQNGTVRFGTDPATSALDLDCRLHDVDNVYVTDSSFFVSSTAVNPTLTIIANALRVADRIQDRLGLGAALPMLRTGSRSSRGPVDLPLPAVAPTGATR